MTNIEMPAGTIDLLRRIAQGGPYLDSGDEHDDPEADARALIAPAVIAELRRVAQSVRRQYADIMLTHRAAALDVADQLDALATQYELNAVR
jgi:hypothetical protein